MKITACLPILAVLGIFSRAGAQGLPFPAEHNNLQPLSQRFLYALAPDQIRIGDVIIQSRQLQAEILEDGGGRRFVFRWPSGVLTKGRLSLLGSNGKALWSSAFDSKSLKIQSAAAPQGEEGIRSDLAQYVSAPFDPSLIQSLSVTSFLSFCVSEVSADTKVYLCSRELVLRRDARKKLVLVPRDRSQKEAFVEMNGKQVATQGLVYLNDEKSDLFMRAQLQSGESLEIVTRRKSVEFRDVLQKGDGPDLFLTTRGAEPVNKKNAKVLGPETFQITLPKARPVYYLLAEGGIPLRQEFLLKGPLPTEEIRPQVDHGWTERTYSAEAELSGPVPANTTLSAKGPDSEVTSENGRFTWKIRGLETGRKNQRLMNVQSGDKSFVAAIEIERGRANEARAALDARLPAGVATTTFLYRRWIENFLWSRASWARLRWGLEGSYILPLNETDDVPKIGGMIFGLSMKFSKAFAEDLSSSGLRLLYGQLKIGDESVASPALEYFHQRNLGKSWAKQVEYGARLWLGGGSDVKLKTSWSLEAAALNPLKPHLHLRYGIGLTQWKTEPALPKESVDLNASVGLVSFF